MVGAWRCLDGQLRSGRAIPGVARLLRAGSPTRRLKGHAPGVVEWFVTSEIRDHVRGAAVGSRWLRPAKHSQAGRCRFRRWPFV